MIENYRYVEESPLDSPIAAFGGWEDGRATQVDLGAWRDLTRGDFALRMFPGGHFFLQSARAPLVETITGALTDPARPPGPGSSDQQTRPATARIPASALDAG
jgi:surfactin synthase thioesterase subunit